MNHTNSTSRALIAAAIAAVLVASCATAPAEPNGAAALRSRLTQLQADPQLAGRAPLAMEQANVAVTAAEQPQADRNVVAHLQFMADRKISIAEAAAHNQWSLDQRKVIAQQRTAMQLQARTAEADAAHRDADAANQASTAARSDADEQRRQAGAARDANADAQRDVANAQRDTADAQRDAADLQQQIVDLQARVTDHGLVLTLGDVLFTTGTANLNSGGTGHLAKLAEFLNQHVDRNVQIVGYTDSVGSNDYNQALSERRADAVKAYLVDRGVTSSRLSASGQGERSPIGDNASDTGRAQNRRVEVTIENALVSAR
jgi:outer membrane protein OmpA-like peptidoglycan-associated protein